MTAIAKRLRTTLNGLTTLAVNTISAVQPSAVAQQETTTGFVPAPEETVPTSGNMSQILTSIHEKNLQQGGLEEKMCTPFGTPVMDALMLPFLYIFVLYVPGLND